MCLLISLMIACRVRDIEEKASFYTNHCNTKWEFAIWDYVWCKRFCIRHCTRAAKRQGVSSDILREPNVEWCTTRLHHNWERTTCRCLLFWQVSILPDRVQGYYVHRPFDTRVFAFQDRNQATINSMGFTPSRVELGDSRQERYREPCSRPPFKNWARRWGWTSGDTNRWFLSR